MIDIAINHRMEGGKPIVDSLNLSRREQTARALIYDIVTGRKPPRNVLTSALQDGLTLEDIQAIRTEALREIFLE